jgi:hypothetical protein
MIATILAFLKAKKLIIYVVIILALIGLGLYFGAKLWRGEMKRMENTYLAALEQLRGENKENMRVLQLSVGEVKQQYPEIKQQLKDMDIKLKNVETVQNVNSVTTNHVNTVLRDSTINDTIVAKIASYKDKWIDFKLINIKDSIRTTIVTKDSIFIALSKVRRNLWQWLTAQPREVTSKVKNYNPNSQITFNRLIKIGK